MISVIRRGSDADQNYLLRIVAPAIMKRHLRRQLETRSSLQASQAFLVLLRLGPSVSMVVGRMAVGTGVERESGWPLVLSSAPHWPPHITEDMVMPRTVTSMPHMATATNLTATAR